MNTTPETPLASVGRKLAKAGSISVAGKILARVIDLLSLIILARLLEPGSFGLVAQAMIVILIVEAVTSVPVAQPILRISDPNPRVYDTAFTLTVLRGLMVALLIAIVAYPTAVYFREPRLPLLLAALALAPILRGCISPRMTVYMRAYNMWPEFISDLASKISSLVLVTIVALSTQSYWAITIGTITTAVVLNLMSYILAPYRPRLSLLYWRDFVDVLGWNTVTQILQSISWQVDRILLGRILPVDVFGQYAIGSNVAEMPQQAIAFPLVNPMMVSFAEAQGSDRLAELWLRFSNTILYVVGPIMVGLGLLSDAVVQVLLGTEWTDAATFISGLAVCALPILPTAPLNPLAIACYKAWLVSLRAAIFLALLLPVMSMGIYFGGAVGAIIAKGLVGTIMYFTSSLIVRKLTGLSVFEQTAELSRSCVGLVVMALVMWGLRDNSLGFVTSSQPLTALKAVSIFGVGCLAFLFTTIGLWSMSSRKSSIEKIILGCLRVKF